MKFIKKTIANTEISTASMPDIVFLLLFFFMVSATIKPQENQVEVNAPKAHALTKVQKQFLIKELIVGKPKDSSLGTEYKISSDNQILQLSELGHWVETQRASIDESYKDQMIILLKSDENVDMGLITDIQKELRKHNARKILYRTLEK